MSSPGPDIACSVCYNSFDVSLRKPIDLGCGHTFCDSCISAHPTSFQRCPECRTPAHNPHISYGLLHLAARADPMTGPATGSQPSGLRSLQQLLYDTSDQNSGHGMSRLLAGLESFARSFGWGVSASSSSGRGSHEDQLGWQTDPSSFPSLHSDPLYEAAPGTLNPGPIPSTSGQAAEGPPSPHGRRAHGHSTRTRQPGSHLTAMPPLGVSAVGGPLRVAGVGEVGGGTLAQAATTAAAALSGGLRVLGGGGPGQQEHALLAQAAAQLPTALHETRASFWSWAAPLLMFVYIISPLDLIPDVIPIIGWLDDMLVLGALVMFLFNMAMQHHQHQPQRPPRRP